MISRTTRRYVRGVAMAFLLYGFVLAVTSLPLLLAKGRSIRLNTFVDVWLAFGLPAMFMLAVVVGPAVLLARRFAGDRLSPVAAAGLGAVCGPLMLIGRWVLFRESDETFGGLLQFWTRVPGEFMIGVLPYAVAGAVFAGWLARNDESVIRAGVRQRSPRSGILPR
jgi:hypothetical protein